MRLITVLTSVSLVCACGTVDRNPVRPTPQFPSSSPSESDPFIASVEPASALAGSSEMTVKVTGRNFAEPARGIQSWAIWSATGIERELRTTVVSSTELSVVVPATLLTTPGSARLRIENGDIMSIGDGFHGYPTSNAVVFTVVSP